MADKKKNAVADLKKKIVRQLKAIAQLDNVETIVLSLQSLIDVLEET